MKELFKRFKLWFTTGKQCRSCCLFCKWFNICYDSYGYEFGFVDAEWEQIFDDSGQK